MNAERLERARAALQMQGTAALLVGPGPDLRYLVGYHALPLERLTLLVLPADGTGVLVVPELEAPRAEASGADGLVTIRSWRETEDPIALVVEALTAAEAVSGPVAVQDRLWTSFTLRLQAALPAATWVAGSSIMRDLRIRKAPGEVAALRAAGAAIDAVHARVPDLLRPGRREVEVAQDLAALIRAEHDEVNFVIVAAGANGASPHHEPGGHVLEDGDPVVVDIGGTLDGYCSDATRDYVVGTPPAGYLELHRVLEEAQEAAVRAVAPGVAAEAIDEAARAVIGAAGHGDHFIHRTGHGIGMEEHEEPWIVAGNTEPVAPGMAFSVEPGIYLPGRFGARIEDIVIVTAGGVERLNHRPREPVVCG